MSLLWSWILSNFFWELWASVKTLNCRLTTKAQHPKYVENWLTSWRTNFKSYSYFVYVKYMFFYVSFNDFVFVLRSLSTRSAFCHHRSVHYWYLVIYIAFSSMKVHQGYVTLQNTTCSEAVFLFTLISPILYLALITLGWSFLTFLFIHPC